MSAEQVKDGKGFCWLVENQHENIKCSPLDIWWSRTPNKQNPKVIDEFLVIRQQDSPEGPADAVLIPLGMVYDLIDALNKAVDNP